MGVYRRYKDKDPKKFLERFSKNLPPSISFKKVEEEKKAVKVSRKREYKVPPPRTAMDYITLEKKCQEFLLGMIEEEDFRDLLEEDNKRLKKFGKGFDNFKFNSKGLSWERELQIKNLFTKSIKEYNEGLNCFKDYLGTKKRKSIKSGLKLISSAGKRLAFIKDISDKEKNQIIEEMKKYFKELEAKEKKISSSPSVEPSSKEILSSPAEEEKSSFFPSSIGENKKIDSSSFAPSARENIEFTPTPSEKSIAERADISSLSSFSIFSGLQVFQLEEIMQFTETSCYSKEAIVYKEGRDANKLYIILFGEVILYKTKSLSSDKFEIIDFRGPGDLIGDMGTLDNGPYATSARISSDEGKLYTIFREDFLNFLSRFPQLSLNLNRIYCKRLREALQRIVHQ